MRLLPWPSAGQQRAALRDRLREERLEAVSTLVDRFLYDLGRLMAGHPVDLEAYVLPALAGSVRASLKPFVQNGDVLRPDFGAHGELRVEGDLLKLERPIQATVEFENRSTLELADGRVRASPRRRIIVWMNISLERACVVGLTLRLGTAVTA